MKNILVISILSLIISSCGKSDTNIVPDQNSTGYDFQDLAIGENLLDSINLKGNFQLKYKFIYKNKNTIGYINKQDYSNFTYKQIVDSFVYNNNLLVNYISHSDNVPQLIKVGNQSNLPSRFYYFEDDYSVPNQRQLGAFISYLSNKPTRINYKFINTSSQRDSIVINIKRNVVGDIDSVFEQNNFQPNSIGSFKFKFEYSNIPNKLSANANLKLLNYFYIPVTLASYSPIIFDFGNIDTYGSNSLDYTLFNAIFCDAIFNGSILPSIFYYKKNNNIIPYFMKYTFNNNNYISSFSIGSSANFNQLTNQKAVFTYYKKP